MFLCFYVHTHFSFFFFGIYGRYTRDEVFGFEDSEVAIALIMHSIPVDHWAVISVVDQSLFGEGVADEILG